VENFRMPGDSPQPKINDDIIPIGVRFQAVQTMQL